MMQTTSFSRFGRVSPSHLFLKPLLGDWLGALVTTERAARNDNRFQRRTWTSLEIQQAANAHMNTHLDALKEQEQTQSGTILLSAGGAQTPQQQIGPAGTTGPTTLSASTIVPTMAIPNATTYTQGINIAYAGTNSTSIHGNNSSTTTLNRWLEPFPRLIRGTRCYTDAST